MTLPKREKIFFSGAFIPIMRNGLFNGVITSYSIHYTKLYDMTLSCGKRFLIDLNCDDGILMAVGI